MEIAMNRRNLLWCGALIFGLAGLMPARPWAAQRGTAADAQAMVAKAIDLYKAQGKASFAIMNRGKATGFRDGDIYIFVFSTGPSAKVVVQAADPKRIDVDVAGITDSRGKAFGREMLARATAEGVWVDYFSINPQTRKEERKSSWVVLYGGYVFGSGVYRAP
jgi:cytochrome c